MWFRTRPCELSYADTARRLFTYDVRIEAPPQAVFELVSQPHLLPRWMPEFKGSSFLTNTPHGVGSLREVKLTGVSVRERILAWEPGQRFSFTMEQISLPLVSRMMEDYRVFAIPTGTRLRWSIAYHPHTWVRMLEKNVAPRFARIFEGAAARLAKVAPDYALSQLTKPS